MANAYHTTDPEKLLELKRLEADALLDLLRTINQAGLEISQLCLITRNLLRAQLGVRKMVFYYELNHVWKEGMRTGFPPLPEDAFAELLEFHYTTAISASLHPALGRYGVQYVVPVSNRDAPIACFAIAEFAETEIELRNDLIFIETLGNILMVAIRNRQFFQEKMAQESLRRELEVAETIQKQLLISDFTHFRDIDVFGLNLSHQRVGGDFYDVIQKENGSIFLCIADVSGKGIGAALLMSNLQANLRALCARYSELPVIVGELNNILHSITEGDKFVTLFLARIDLPTRTFTYVNAGHNYPLFLTGAEALRLETGCMLLGILPDLHIQQDTLPYFPGDLLFTFTDGVVEQGDPSDELFGSERLAEELFRVRHAPAREVVNQVERTLYAFAQEVGPSDDITMLAVKFLNES